VSGLAGEPSGAAPFPPVERDAASAGFFDAAARGELLLRRAPDGEVFGPQDDVGARFGTGDLEPLVASGDATLVSWAVVHQAPLPWLAGAVPYVCAVVELAEGPWLTVRLVGVDVGADPGALVAGQPLRVRFVASGPADGPGETLPVFAPA
jgi:uncharacterized OB-fold protein